MCVISTSTLSSPPSVVPYKYLSCDVCCWFPQCVSYPPPRCLLLPRWFHISTCHVMFVAGFLSVCHIHLHVVFVISFSTGSCLVLSHSVVLDTLSDQFRYKILRRHLLMKLSLSAPANSFYQAPHVDNPALSIDVIAHYIAVNRRNKQLDNSLENR